MSLAVPRLAHVVGWRTERILAWLVVTGIFQVVAAMRLHAEGKSLGEFGLILAVDALAVLWMIAFVAIPSPADDRLGVAFGEVSRRLRQNGDGARRLTPLGPRPCSWKGTHGSHVESGKRGSSFA